MLLLRDYTYAFCSSLKNQLILLFSLFLLIFMGPTTLFGTIHASHCIILANFYFYLPYSQQKNFSFNKISGFQTQARLCNLSGTCKCCYLIFFFWQMSCRLVVTLCFYMKKETLNFLINITKTHNFRHIH